MSEIERSRVIHSFKQWHQPPIQPKYLIKLFVVRVFMCLRERRIEGGIHIEINTTLNKQIPNKKQTNGIASCHSSIIVRNVRKIKN